MKKKTNSKVIKYPKIEDTYFLVNEHGDVIDNYRTIKQAETEIILNGDDESLYFIYELKPIQVLKRNITLVKVK